MRTDQNTARLSLKVGNIPGSASDENIYKVLENVENATENLTISLLASTKHTELGRDLFDGLHFPHLKSLEVNNIRTCCLYDITVLS